MRIGDSHRDVTIVLLGAMSRWVNHLDDSDMADKKTKLLLKALRESLCAPPPPRDTYSMLKHCRCEPQAGN